MGKLCDKPVTPLYLKIYMTSIKEIHGYGQSMSFMFNQRNETFFADALLRLPALAVNRALRIDRKGAALKVEEQVPRWTR